MSRGFLTGVVAAACALFVVQVWAGDDGDEFDIGDWEDLGKGQSEESRTKDALADGWEDVGADDGDVGVARSLVEPEGEDEGGLPISIALSIKRNGDIMSKISGDNHSQGSTPYSSLESSPLSVMDASASSTGSSFEHSSLHVSFSESGNGDDDITYIRQCFGLTDDDLCAALNAAYENEAARVAKLLRLAVEGEEDFEDDIDSEAAEEAFDYEPAIQAFLPMSMSGLLQSQGMDWETAMGSFSGESKLLQVFKLMEKVQLLGLRSCVQLASVLGLDERTVGDGLEPLLAPLTEGINFRKLSGELYVKVALSYRLYRVYLLWHAWRGGWRMANWGGES